MQELKLDKTSNPLDQDVVDYIGSKPGSPYRIKVKHLKHGSWQVKVQKRCRFLWWTIWREEDLDFDGQRVLFGDQYPSGYMRTNEELRAIEDAKKWIDNELGRDLVDYIYYP